MSCEAIAGSNCDFRAILATYPLTCFAMILPLCFEPFRWRDFSLQIQENIEHN
jgi:hypothetical protein